MHTVRYVSTRGKAPDLNFEDAMLTGLARDGGLYVPAEIPAMTAGNIAALSGLSYEQVALRILTPYIGDTFDEPTLQGLVEKAYGGFRHAARAPLKQIQDNHFLLELFHGPTLAFKDFAMQLIGHMFQAVLARRGHRATIVGATSGDTGSAAMAAFGGLENIDVFILYPDGRVSDVQRRQMTTVPHHNTHALAVDGDFDACQARVKDMFNDFPFRDAVGLAAINSINIARVLAQIVYYFTAAVAVGAPHRTVNFCVPTGNFGDIFAGYLAKQMGLPIEVLVIATNQNDILHRALQSGIYEIHGVAPSISPSMDIQVSSNFERALFDAYGRDGHAVEQAMHDLRTQGKFQIGTAALAALRAEFASGRASEDETRAMIAYAMAEMGEVLCPHSAVGVHVAQNHLGQTPLVTLATAHPAKFPDAVAAATGQRPTLPLHMADLFDRPERMTKIDNNLTTIETLIRGSIHDR